MNDQPDIETVDEQFENPLKDKIKKYSIYSGIALFFLGVILLFTVDEQLGGSMAILGIIISVVPLSLFSYLDRRQIKQMESEFPSFLKGLAESKRGGMTLLSAFESAKETDYGKLNSETEKVYYELSWGIPFPQVMDRFGERVSESELMQRSLSIIIQSFESGGKITQTIDSVADEATKLKEIVQKKDSQLKQQLIIMYIIYLLFIAITIGLYFMIDQLLGLGSPGGGALDNLGDLDLASGGDINYCSDGILPAEFFCTIARIFGFVPADIEFGTEVAINSNYEKMAYYKSLLFSILMVQGVSISAVVGKINEGKASAGIKHALVLITTAFLAFMLLVAPRGL